MPIRPLEVDPVGGFADCRDSGPPLHGVVVPLAEGEAGRADAEGLGAGVISGFVGPRHGGELPELRNRPQGTPVLRNGPSGSGDSGTDRHGDHHPALEGDLAGPKKR